MARTTQLGYEFSVLRQRSSQLPALRTLVLIALEPGVHCVNVHVTFVFFFIAVAVYFGFWLPDFRDFQSD